MKILFLGNSFTHRGPVPMLLHRLAARGGRSVQAYAVAPEAASLRDHLMSDQVEHAMRFGGWDALILQGQSVRPTSRLGDPEAFAADAAELAALCLDHSPSAAIWLVQTWARHIDHMNWLQDSTSRFYPYYFIQPREMLDELRASTHAAALGIRAAHPGASVDVLALGDAWRDYASRAGAVRLHDTDCIHANPQGQWLCAALWHRVLLGALPAGWAEGSVDEGVWAFCEGWAHLGA